MKVKDIEIAAQLKDENELLKERHAYMLDALERNTSYYGMNAIPHWNKK